MAADGGLAEVRADAARRVPSPPTLDDVVEEAGRQRLAAYYVYSALIAGVIGEEDLEPVRWPPPFTEPMERLGLTKFAPRTDRGLDAELTPAEQATRRGSGREFEFAQLAVDLINRGAFGPVRGEADSVRLADTDEGHDLDLELLAGSSVVGKCKAESHWEFVAQALASKPHGDDPLAEQGGAHALTRVERQVKEHGISHAVSKTTELAVGVYPLGTAVGAGTRLVRKRIQTGRDEAEALHHLGQVLRTLRFDAEGELDRRSAEHRT